MAANSRDTASRSSMDEDSRLKSTAATAELVRTCVLSGGPWRIQSTARWSRTRSASRASSGREGSSGTMSSSDSGPSRQATAVREIMSRETLVRRGASGTRRFR